MARALIVEADGGSRGNPGVAGYGALVRDASTGELLAERAEPLGSASNNVAEYSGLIAGLEAAAEIDPSARVEVRMDSKLVVEQMAGRWKIKHEDMKRLALEAQEIVRSLTTAGGTVTWTWIPREKNKDADKLSNVAMDGETVVRNLWRTTEPDDRDDPAEVSEPAVDATDAEAAAAPAPAPAQAGRPVRVLLVRHGVTDFTVEGRLDGRGGPNPDLNEQGLAQARSVAAGIAAKTGDLPVRFIASDLSRAQETIRPAAEARGRQVEIDPDWDEQNFGEWDGELVRDLVQHKDFARLRDDPTYAAPGGGETHEQLTSRVRDALRRAVESASDGSVVVVATHRKPIMVVLAEVLGLDLAHAWMLAIGPGSFTGLELWADGHGSVSFVNDTNHLRATRGARAQ
ncbi:MULTISPECIES: bifunctional RNase H/acid phosphatase [unclassified Yimella]|uniref:bifunctional RNase H/acid phosphatase n=1 Tax=unclassified Yimella TaxID=2649892 RepID=UPI00101DCBCA|nr:MULTISPECIES: bifunctional RNase H/acid phosphatase [unclassified Yimella]MCG8655041.1 bifunctional RNase H/acid phosphatase [Yimella sp. NH-Cas1]RYG76282.1 bifunctional RNase H/acid phosphatase [Yimella sp. RIT 621]